MSERYQGGYITASVINPNGQMDAVATGVWSLMEQFYFNVDGKIEYVEQWIRDKKE